MNQYQIDYARFVHNLDGRNLRGCEEYFSKVIDVLKRYDASARDIDMATAAYIFASTKILANSC